MAARSCRTFRSPSPISSSKPAGRGIPVSAVEKSQEKLTHTRAQRPRLRHRQFSHLRQAHHLQGIQQRPGERLRTSYAVAARGQSLRGLALTLPADRRPHKSAVGGCRLATQGCSALDAQREIVPARGRRQGRQRVASCRHVDADIFQGSDQVGGQDALRAGSSSWLGCVASLRHPHPTLGGARGEVVKTSLNSLLRSPAGYHCQATR